MSMAEMAREILDDAGSDWEVEDESVLICPCGDTIEWDGACPECGPSPLRTLGLI